MLSACPAQAESKRKLQAQDKEAQQDGSPPEPNERNAAMLARGRIGHAVKDWFSPRLMVAGGGLFMSLSRWGLIPAVRQPCSIFECICRCAPQELQTAMQLVSGMHAQHKSAQPKSESAGVYT